MQGLPRATAQERIAQGCEQLGLAGELERPPDGRTLYVSNEEDGALGVIDVASGKRLKSVAVGEEPEGVKVSPDGKRVYVTSEVANMVHVVDAASGEIVKNIVVPKRPRRLVFTPDGSELWVTNELGASVTVISTRDLAITHTVKFELEGMRPDDISPVGLAMRRARCWSANAPGASRCRATARACTWPTGCRTT